MRNRRVFLSLFCMILLSIGGVFFWNVREDVNPVCSTLVTTLGPTLETESEHDFCALVLFAQNVVRSEATPDYLLWQSLMTAFLKETTSEQLLKSYWKAVRILATEGQSIIWRSLAIGDEQTAGLYSTRLTFGQDVYQYTVKCPASVSSNFKSESFTTTENLLSLCFLIQTQQWPLDQSSGSYKHHWDEFGTYTYAAG